MTFAERLTAGPPALATVARRPEPGDLVWSRKDGDIHEVTHVYPAIVGSPLGIDAVSLAHREPVRLAHRDAVVLTKVEAVEAREHYAAPESGCPDCGNDTITLDDPDDEMSARCTDPRCGWRL